MMHGVPQRRENFIKSAAEGTQNDQRFFAAVENFRSFPVIYVILNFSSLTSIFVPSTGRAVVKDNVCHENIKRFEDLIKTATNPDQVRMLRLFLKEEKNKVVNRGSP
ncbi:hypothetical protein SAMN05444678_12324 [Sphingomonas sp. YR710]|uniref:hypothetical protein n=1 Tax=Sphingomonas sp. YR710 TaxID=1882773 RepID=UPI0008875914|nr:hypothetical protein [Sphingomonas sp. YR710]SDD80680.1 hypothetical protein SAMN05444678_12324 [Sphingomonas sp. YR710]